MKALRIVQMFAGLIALAGCSTSTSTAPVPVAPTTPAVLAAPQVSKEVPVPAPFLFDLGVFDPVAVKYYQTDAGRNQIDVIDVATGTLGSPLATGAFAGNKTVGFDMSHNGPNGIVYVPGTTPLLYIGDANAVQIVDPAKAAVVKTVTVSTTGIRADEGCYDPDDSIVLYASGEESPAFVSFISTKTQAVLVKYVFSADTAGLEACVYDSASKSFLINNDGTTANPDGEVDVIPAASVVAAAPAISKTFPLPGCDPTGIALGPGTDVLIGCNQGAPLPILFSYILNRTNGTVVATPAFGGVDQVAYDPTTNRYFLPGFFDQANGVPGALSTAVPMLGVVDGASHDVLYEVPMGYIGHSISVDSTDGKLFIPHFPATATQATAFPMPGVTIYTTH